MAGHGHDHGHAPDPLSPDLLAAMKYETRDIALNTLILWFGNLIIFIVIVTTITLFLYSQFVPGKAELERTSPLASVRVVPPHPQLQVAPKRDMIEYRLAEKHEFSEPTKNADGTVNLPIERAMKMLADEKGISGKKGSEPAPERTAFPGSGDYTNTGNAPAAEGTHDDVTNSHEAGSPASHEGTPEAGSTEHAAPHAETPPPGPAHGNGEH
jgi:hypothetical protein